MCWFLKALFLQITSTRNHHHWGFTEYGMLWKAWLSDSVSPFNNSAAEFPAGSSQLVQIKRCFIHKIPTLLSHRQGRTEGGKGSIMPQASKSPNNIASIFFNTVHLLPGGAKLASCPGHHLTSVRPCSQSVSHSLSSLQTTVIHELHKAHDWMSLNKLLINYPKYLTKGKRVKGNLANDFSVTAISLDARKCLGVFSDIRKR